MMGAAPNQIPVFINIDVMSKNGDAAIAMQVEVMQRMAFKYCTGAAKSNYG